MSKFLFPRLEEKSLLIRFISSELTKQEQNKNLQTKLYFNHSIGCQYYRG